MEILADNITKTKEFAEKIAAKLRPGDIVALYGDLGAGKTTFVSLVCGALGFNDRVQSPTFVISRIYGQGSSGSGIKSVNHLDLYRLQTAAEAVEIGIQDFMNQHDSVLFIEWPEIIENLLPEKTIKFKFEILSEAERKIYVQNMD